MTLLDFFAENPKLRSQWMPEKNPDDPRALSTQSRKKAWWRCGKGHAWQARIDSRIHLDRGCPYCAGQLVSAGETDFGTVTPEKLKFWHTGKNGGFLPSDVMPGSRKILWWKCEHGHEWQAPAYSIKAGTACPYCAGKRILPGENDLATTHSHLLKMWSEKNSIQPTEVTAGSHKKVRWTCEKGHEWEAVIGSVSAGDSGCPYCSGRLAIPGETDLATVRPDILEEWDYERNTLDPGEILPSSHEKAWWKCRLGHSWEAAVFSRTREKPSGCPYCTGKKVLAGFNDLGTVKPKVAKEWHPTLNGELTPDKVTLGSNKKVWWKCAEGHVWQAAVYARTRKKGSGCPVCAGTVKNAERRANPRRMNQTSMRV